MIYDTRAVLLEPLLIHGHVLTFHNTALLYTCAQTHATPFGLPSKCLTKCRRSVDPSERQT